MSNEPSLTICENELVKLPQKSKKRQRSTKRLSNSVVGRVGEDQAKTYCLSLGWKILETNLRLFTWEIDIIALDPAQHEIVFIEVKSRSSGTSADALQAVSRKKLSHMTRSAELYLEQNRLDTQDYRFDIITITGGELNHYRNVTWEMVK